MTLFRSKNQEKENDSADFINKLDKVIQTILAVLENLNTLDRMVIGANISTNNFYLDEIFYRLKIENIDEFIKEIKEFYPKVIIGYGSKRLEEIKVKLENIKNRDEINDTAKVEEMIFVSRLEIARYKEILKDLNLLIERIKSNNKLLEADKIALIDYWISFYKTEKLGFKLDINSEISLMIKELKELEYGGYGDKELNRFEEICLKEYLNYCKNNNDIENIIQSIKANIFNPMLIRYRSELEILKKKLALLNLTNELSNLEKKLKEEEFIIDFNEKHGHKIDLSSQLLSMKKGLQELRYGGYGEAAIDKFINYSQSLIVKEKEKNKTDKEILALIRLEFKRSVKWFNKKLEKIEKRLDRINDSELKKELLKDFKEEMEKPINLAEKIAKLTERLKDANLYSDQVIERFTKQCKKIERESIFYNDRETFVDEVDELYENIVTNKDKTAINHLKSRVEIFSKKLAKLNEYGYGESAINEFRELCFTIIKSSKTLKEKYLLIDQKYRMFEDNYYANFKVFTIWKDKNLIIKQDNKEEIEKQFHYMISLSPKELQNYYKEDSKNKKQAMINHNNKVIVNYLAKKEALAKNNSLIIDERMMSFFNNNIPYSEEDIESAKEEIETKNELLNEKLISFMEYIDSTIFKQILNIRLNELHNKNN